MPYRPRTLQGMWLSRSKQIAMVSNQAGNVGDGNEEVEVVVQERIVRFQAPSTLGRMTAMYSSWV